MSDTPEYILKPGVTISDDVLLWGANMVAITVRDEQGVYRGLMARALFERAFVPLDRQALQIAIREEIREYAESMLPDYGVPIHKTERLDSAVNAVLVLFGLENKETE